MMKRGKLAMTICSTAFLGMGKLQSRALGMPQMPIVVIDHPFGSRSRDEVRAIAATCADEMARLTGKGPDGRPAHRSADA